MRLLKARALRWLLLCLCVIGGWLAEEHVSDMPRSEAATGWQLSVWARAVENEGKHTRRELRREGNTVVSYAEEQAPFKNVKVPPAPAERVFTIKNDNCGQYLTPADQEHPLIYEDELQYTKGANGEHQASWVQKDALKLPIYCQYCAEKAETDAQGQVKQPNDYVIYFGIDFLKGSTVCVSVSNDGKRAKSLHPLIAALLGSASQGSGELQQAAVGRERRGIRGGRGEREELEGRGRSSDADPRSGTSSLGQGLQAELFALERGSAKGAGDEATSMSLTRPQSIIISTLEMGKT